LFMHVLGKK